MVILILFGDIYASDLIGVLDVKQESKKKIKKIGVLGHGCEGGFVYLVTRH